MFAIYVSNLGKYIMKDHSKVIVFDNPREVSAFADAFFNYAMAQAMSPMSGVDMGLIGEVMSARMQTQVEELPSSIKMEIVNFNDLKTH